MKASFFKSALLTIGAIAILASCNLLKKDETLRNKETRLKKSLDWVNELIK